MLMQIARFSAGPIALICGTLCTALQFPAENETHQCPLGLYQRLPRLADADIKELGLLQAHGRLTSVEITQGYIHRIKEVNQHLHSISEINPDALIIAQRLDAERAAGHTRGPLHGIPILIKDNIATLDRMNNTAGSFALLGATVYREATVATRLRQAGAVILGKTTMGEWAQMRSMIGGSSHGWSPYGGQPLGAYYPLQDPSGSSSGSCVAAALGLSVGALASETSGSILLPAEKSNVVGIKPTLGLTSRAKIIPISLRQDTVGSVAQTVKNAAYLLSAMAGKDKEDNWTYAQPFDEVPDYVKACRISAIRGARIGVPRNGIDYYLTKSTGPIMTAFDKSLKVIADAGAVVVDGADFTIFDPPMFNRNSDLVLDVDFAEGLRDYLSELATNPENVNNLEDLINFSKSDPREEWPDRNIGVWERALNRSITTSSSESYTAYEANRRMAEEDGITGALDSYGLDALVMPTFASFRLPAIAGLPVITVPLGFFPAETEVVWNARGDMVDIAPGIPFGISFLGRKWSEETLIGLAYAYEQRTMVMRNRKPLIRPKSELSDQQDIFAKGSFLGKAHQRSVASNLWHDLDEVPSMLTDATQNSSWPLRGSIAAFS